MDSEKLGELLAKIVIAFMGWVLTIWLIWVAVERQDIQFFIAAGIWLIVFKMMIASAD